MTDPTPLPPSPEAVRDLAAACARFVEQALGIPLDGTQDTLPLLDHYLTTVAVDVSADVAALVAPAAGAYFGELVRSALGDGVWEWDDAEPLASRLVLAAGHLRLAPLEAALEALHREAAPDAPPVLEASDRARGAVQAAFDDFGAIRAEDFFRLSVRFDALVQAHARVVADTRAGSNGAG